MTTLTKKKYHAEKSFHENNDNIKDYHILLLLMLCAAWLTSLQFILNPNTCEVNILPCS